MAIEALEVRMARLEGGYEQINERLAGVEREIGALRSELKVAIESLRTELKSEIAMLRADNADIRRQMQTQFYWTLTLILGAVLFPVLRDLALNR